MKYLFIILTAFSFIGCDGDTQNSTRTIYATMTIPTNNDNISTMTITCGGTTVAESSPDFVSPLPSGTTISTDPFVANYVPFNVVCTAFIQGITTSGGTISTNYGPNTEMEINLYVDEQLYETRVVTGGTNGGGGNVNFIVN